MDANTHRTDADVCCIDTNTGCTDVDTRPTKANMCDTADAKNTLHCCKHASYSVDMCYIDANIRRTAANMCRAMQACITICRHMSH